MPARVGAAGVAPTDRPSAAEKARFADGRDLFYNDTARAWPSEFPQLPSTVFADWRDQYPIMMEIAVVAVIDDLSEAGMASYIEFKVHRSPDDPDLVLGSWRYAHGERVIDQSKPGTSITMEFRFAVDCADQNGIPFVWVNDPEELFPLWERR